MNDNIKYCVFPDSNHQTESREGKAEGHPWQADGGALQGYW